LWWVLKNAFGRYCQRSEAEAKRKAGCEKEEGGECGSVEQQSGVNSRQIKSGPIREEGQRRIKKSKQAVRQGGRG